MALKIKDGVIESDYKVKITFNTKPSKDAVQAWTHTAEFNFKGARVEPALRKAASGWVIDIQRRIRDKGLKVFPQSDTIKVDVANIASSFVSQADPKEALKELIQRIKAGGEDAEAALETLREIDADMAEMAVALMPEVPVQESA